MTCHWISNEHNFDFCFLWPAHLASFTAHCFTECMLTQMLTVQRDLVCVWGGAFPLTHLLCTVTTGSHIYSVSFFFFSLVSLLCACSVCPLSLFFLSHVLMSDIRAHITQAHNRGHTGSHIHQSSIIPPPSPLSAFLLSLLDFFGCCSSIIATVLCIYSLVLLTASGICNRLRWVF